MSTHRILAYKDADYLATGSTRVLMALLARHDDTGRATVRDLAEDMGWSPSTVHSCLLRLRAEGLVTWEEGQAGTLRPTAAFVDLGSPEGVPQ